jgi:hypothetical protein
MKIPTLNEYIKQFIRPSFSSHPLDCYKIPLSVIIEKYEKLVM